MCYVLYEFRRFLRCDFGDRPDFNPIGEFVNGYDDVLVAARGGFERPYGVKTPHGEGLRSGNLAQDLS
jgi:hypothetical protein